MDKLTDYAPNVGILENLQLEDVVDGETFPRTNNEIMSSAAPSIVDAPPLTTTSVQAMTKTTYSHTNNNTTDNATRVEQKECIDSPHSHMEAEQNAEIPSTTYKSPCCLTFPLPPMQMQSFAPTLAITTPLPAAASSATNDLSRAEHWYAHAHVHAHPHPHPHSHHHHHHHHHHQQLSEDLVVYTPPVISATTSVSATALASASATPIEKLGIDSSTDGYLSARIHATTTTTSSVDLVDLNRVHRKPLPKKGSWGKTP